MLTLTDEEFLALPKGTEIFISFDPMNPFMQKPGSEERPTLEPYSIGRQLSEYCQVRKPLRENDVFIASKCISITLK